MSFPSEIIEGMVNISDSLNHLVETDVAVSEVSKAAKVKPRCVPSSLRLILISCDMWKLLAIGSIIPMMSILSFVTRRRRRKMKQALAFCALR
jgi:hypothetical protein